jgi:hypothetical protein
MTEHSNATPDIDDWLAFDDAYAAFVAAYPMLGLNTGMWAAVNLRRNFGARLVATGTVRQLKNRKWLAHRDTFGPALFNLLQRAPAEIIEEARRRSSMPASET